MSDDYVWDDLWLDNYGFVYNSVLFIPCGYWLYLTEAKWNRINSIVRGVL